ncbi:MAG: ABC transporter ATP-binding protein [Vicinamibacterales bacterium]
MTPDEDVLGKAYDARLLRRLLRYLLPYRWSAALALLAISASAALQLVQPWLTKLLIDRYIAAGDLRGIDWVALALLSVLAASFVMEYAQTWLMQLTGQRIMFDMRMQVYEHLQRLSLPFYDRNPVGRLMTRVTNDVDVLNELFSAGVVSVFGDMFMLVGIALVLMAMDWRLALVTFSVLPLIAWITQWFRRHVRDSYREVRVWLARINATLQENIAGMSTVQLFRREDRNFEAFDTINRAHRDANVTGIFYYAVFYPVVEVIAALATALIIWWGGRWTLEGTLTLGSLVAFLLYSRRFFQPISDLSEKFNMLQSAMAASERIFTLLDTPVTVGAPVRPAARPPGGAGRIVFERVWFAYHGDEYVLRDVSFEVSPGERVGVVGATGAGKSTIISLLLRFYDVTRGRITVDGVDIRDLAVSDLRGLFGLVLQDVHLFSGTIASNIRLGDATISDEAVRAAARAVRADTFIGRLPDGFDTPVAERGAALSVGQKQLLSFARALAFEPRILILDEATSSVDTETELLIRDALAVLMRGRTTIAIAHRLSTIQGMDKILVMHKGTLRETGRHQELLALRGIYHRLYQLQYREQEVGLP